ncbi:hypothetical protein STSP2_03555 [Anaerohalosphaera lusitana]|uniref:Uncharacterized protein n=1 Tax=Anaerohalosphaera lusitana TaxID=1936003 RepID=A0A1U9NR08_9BACT|nr:hypothetical protein [Anaerohalosphaera lusitana]AQT70349.1 hypothetical protein STSP2_03555 [Anaerohalosphaera lusitana]
MNKKAIVYFFATVAVLALVVWLASSIRQHWQDRKVKPILVEWADHDERVDIIFQNREVETLTSPDEIKSFHSNISEALIGHVKNVKSELLEYACNFEIVLTGSDKKIVLSFDVYPKPIDADAAEWSIREGYILYSDITLILDKHAASELVKILTKGSGYPEIE